MSEEQLQEIYQMIRDMPEGAPAKAECHILLLELRRTRGELEAVKRERDNKDAEFQRAKEEISATHNDLSDVIDRIKGWENEHTHEVPAVKDLAERLKDWL